MACSPKAGARSLYSIARAKKPVKEGCRASVSRSRPKGVREYAHRSDQKDIRRCNNLNDSVSVDAGQRFEMNEGHKCRPTVVKQERNRGGNRHAERPNCCKHQTEEQALFQSF